MIAGAWNSPFACTDPKTNEIVQKTSKSRYAFYVLFMVSNGMKKPEANNTKPFENYEASRQTKCTEGPQRRDAHPKKDRRRFGRLGHALASVQLALVRMLLAPMSIEGV